MLYLIGLGLNERGISLAGLEAIKKCKKIYLESYTVNFPYSLNVLEKEIGKKVISAEREFVENMEELLEEAKKTDTALLVYGSPLTATTHISLIEEARKKKIKYEIIYSASVLDAIAETGLQLYKFGRTASLPMWKKNFRPESFMDIVKKNQSINAHTLILADIGLNFGEAIEELKEAGKNQRFRFDRIVVCSKLGTGKSRIFYGSIESLKNRKIDFPYCIIIPGKLHFVEEEFLNGIK